MHTPFCDVCGAKMAEGVCRRMPGLGVSIAYCRECWEANAHPVPILASQVWMLDDEISPTLRRMIDDTLQHLHIPPDDFQHMVRCYESAYKTMMLDAEDTCILSDLL